MLAEFPDITEKGVDCRPAGGEGGGSCGTRGFFGDDLNMPTVGATPLLARSIGRGFHFLKTGVAGENDGHEMAIRWLDFEPLNHKRKC